MASNDLETMTSGGLPAVAVLLATYDGAAHCESQLISLLWQRDVSTHIYVRDDGSRDATPAIMEAWAARHPDRITVVDGGGVSTGSATGNFFALLTGVDLSDYDYIALADQDDVWMPDKLARAVAAMTAHAADGYSSDLIAYDVVDNAAWMLRKAGQPADLDYLFQGGSAGCTYVFTRSAARMAAGVVRASPPLCPGASHDWILYAICRSRGLTWVRDPAAEILYRQHGSNLYGARRGLADLVVKLRLTRSHWYRNHILWMRNVVVGSADECAALDAVARGRIGDRWQLLRQASRFRRAPASVWQLRLAIASRMI